MRDLRLAGAPPLWVWAAGVGLAIVLLAASLAPFLDARDAPVVAADWMDAAIDSFGAEHPPGAGTFRAIAFGDSALGTATLQLEEMAARARADEGVDVAFLRLTRPFALLHHVLGEIDRAIAARPDVVMIDSWMLVYTPDKLAVATYAAFQAESDAGIVSALGRVVERPSLVLEHQAYLFDRLTGSTQGQIPTDLGPRKRDARPPGTGLRCDQAGRNRLLRGAERKYPAGADLQVDARMLEALETLLRRARDQGVRIVFFDVPKAAPMEALPGVKRKRALTRELIRDYARRGAVLYFEYDEELDDGDTCDYVHYSAAGRDRYLPWFTRQLASLAKQEAGR